MSDVGETTTDLKPAAGKPYVKPAIVHELKLETRAGSPFGGPLIDPLGVNPDQPK